MTDETRKLRETRRLLRTLTQSVDYFLMRLDGVMKGPSTEERGRVVAEIANGLDMQNQIAKRFGLAARSRRAKEDGRHGG